MNAMLLGGFSGGRSRHRVFRAVGPLTQTQVRAIRIKAIRPNFAVLADFEELTTTGRGRAAADAARTYGCT